MPKIQQHINVFARNQSFQRLQGCIRGTVETHPPRSAANGFLNQSFQSFWQISTLTQNTLADEQSFYCAFENIRSLYTLPVERADLPYPLNVKADFKALETSLNDLHHVDVALAYIQGKLSMQTQKHIGCNNNLYYIPLDNFYLCCSKSHSIHFQVLRQLYAYLYQKANVNLPYYGYMAGLHQCLNEYNIEEEVQELTQAFIALDMAKPTLIHCLNQPLINLKKFIALANKFAQQYPLSDLNDVLRAYIDLHSQYPQYQPNQLLYSPKNENDGCLYFEQYCCFIWSYEDVYFDTIFEYANNEFQEYSDEESIVQTQNFDAHQKQINTDLADYASALYHFINLFCAYLSQNPNPVNHEN